MPDTDPTSPTRSASPHRPRATGWVVAAPNALSGARLALAGAFALLPPSWWPAAIVVAGLTDFVDGLVARRFGAASWVGGLLDAVSDKAFVFAVLLTFAADGRLGVAALLGLIVRDLTVGFIAAYAAAIRHWHAFHRMPARPAGKLTTAVLFVTLVVLAAWPTASAAWWLTAASIALSAIAAADYFVVFVRAELARRAKRG